MRWLSLVSTSQTIIYSRTNWAPQHTKLLKSNKTQPSIIFEPIEYSRLTRYNQTKTTTMAIKFASYFKKSSSSNTTDSFSSTKKDNKTQQQAPKINRQTLKSSNSNASNTSHCQQKKVKVVRVSFVNNNNGSTFQMNWTKASYLLYDQKVEEWSEISP